MTSVSFRTRPAQAGRAVRPAAGRRATVPPPRAPEPAPELRWREARVTRLDRAARRVAALLPAGVPALLRAPGGGGLRRSTAGRLPGLPPVPPLPPLPPLPPWAAGL